MSLCVTHLAPTQSRERHHFAPPGDFAPVAELIPVSTWHAADEADLLDCTHETGGAHVSMPVWTKRALGVGRVGDNDGNGGR